MNNKDHQVNWLGYSLVWQAAGELQRHIYLAAPLVGATLPIGLVSYVRGLRTQRRRQKWTKQLQIYLWLISSEVNTVEMGKKGKAFYGTPSQRGQLRIQPQPHLITLNEWTGLFSLSNLRKFHWIGKSGKSRKIKSCTCCLPGSQYCVAGSGVCQREKSLCGLPGGSGCPTFALLQIFVILCG